MAEVFDHGDDVAVLGVKLPDLILVLLISPQTDLMAPWEFVLMRLDIAGDLFGRVLVHIPNGALGGGCVRRGSGRGLCKHCHAHRISGLRCGGDRLVFACGINCDYIGIGILLLHCRKRTAEMALLSLDREIFFQDG